MSGYDSLEDVWRWECPECPRVVESWNPETLEAVIELHEAVVHGIYRATATPPSCC
jgi:hypothetical protein